MMIKKNKQWFIRQHKSGLCYAALTLAGCLPFPGLFASEVTENSVQWYQTSIVIFQHADSNRRVEKWPSPQPHYRPLSAITLYSPEELRFSGYREKRQKLLPMNQWSLRREAQTIRRNRNFHLIYHASWLTPLKKEKSSLLFNIQAGAETLNHRELEGTIRFTRNRYLHAEVDLWYNQINPFNSLTTLLQTHRLLAEPVAFNMIRYHAARKPKYALYNLPYTGNFNMKDSERLKNGKLTYFDSPVLGVLAEINVIDENSPLQKYIPGYTDKPASDVTVKDLQEKPSLP